MDDEDIAEQLQYQRMLRQGVMKITDIVQIPIKERNPDQKLFFEMYLKNCVPFFSEYNKYNIRNISKALKTVTFKKNQIIFQIGDPCDKCYIIVLGEVGIYYDKNFE